ncbi:MAG: hypothetical protein ACR2RV_02565, partial [Verrucomicrobiales bacterium]
ASPFCSYKDYWGSYEYSEETGALRLAISGGNKIPRGFGSSVEGHLRFVGDHRIAISGFRLHPESEEASTYTFKRNHGWGTPAERSPSRAVQIDLGGE